MSDDSAHSEEQAEEPKEPFAQDLATFMATGPDHVEWLVPDLLPRGGLAILAARPKAGKSLLSLNLGLGGRHGQFLGRTCLPFKTLICQLEDPPPIIRERITKMGPAAGVYIRAGLGMGGSDWLELPGFICENDIDLVVIDPLVFAAGGSDENDAAKMGRFFLRLREIAFGTGAGVLVVHHHRKGSGEHGDAIRGSSAILGAVDVALELKREEEASTATLVVTSRLAAVEPETLTLDVETLTWQSRGSAEDWKRSKRENEIMTALHEEGELDQRGLSDALGVSAQNFRPELKQLVAKGPVIERKEAASKGRPRYFYRLADFSPEATDPNGEKYSTPDQAKETPGSLFAANKNSGVPENGEKPGSEVAELVEKAFPGAKRIDEGGPS